MKRRLYFLFPDPLHARHAVDRLQDDVGVVATDVHAMANQKRQLARLPLPTAHQQTDLAARLETWLWNGNLLLFAVALLAMLAALAANQSGWALAALLVMVLSFSGGFLFTARIPHVHLREFREALAHGEILLMIDVPAARVGAVEDYIHHRYPEAVPGGSSWSIGALGL